MNKITAPYNFVPLNEKVFIPTWHDKVSQDIPFEDGEDGYIEVAWKNVSPLFVRDCSESAEKTENIHSMHIMQPDGKRLYFIPGSTLKGMLRSVLTIMSFGKMTSYNDSYFGHREVDTKITGAKSYHEEMEKVEYGWLRQKGEEYFLYPCIGEADQISIEDVEREYGYYNGKKLTSAWKCNDYIGKNTFPTPKGKTGYRLFATGWMKNKKHEMLIPEATGEPIKLNQTVIDSFFSVYAPTPDFEKYKAMLAEQKEIPVSYIHDEKRGYILGMGRMIRYPYKHSVRSLVEKGQKPKKEGEHDLCETIFGWVDEGDGQSSMKGRVQVGNAFATRSIADSELSGRVLGVLGQPKASYFPLYLKQDRNKTEYYTYDSDEARISGRKRYRIHMDGTTTPLPDGNGNEDVKTQLHPVGAGQTFVMRINVHNLRKVEIGALLSAITFHRAKNVWHSVGGAKSFGYGKIECSSLALHGLKYGEHEYLCAFEKMMDTVVDPWISSPQMKALVAIASEHDDEDVTMMKMSDSMMDNNGKKQELPGYKYYKTNNHFSQLRDTSSGVPTAFSEKDRHTEKYADKYAEIETFRNNGEWTKAYIALGKLIDGLRKEGLPSDEEQEMLKEIEIKKAMAEAETQQQEQEARLKGGLTGLLNECYPDSAGKNAGQYKVQKWDMCQQKVSKWMKEAEEDRLTPDEQDVLEQTIIRLKATTDKKERKMWGDFKSARWKKISEWLSPERAEQIYNR